MSDMTGGRSLAGAVIVAIGASVCCIGPLMLLMLGVSGAWIANLTVLEPYRPILIGVTLGFLAFAFRKLYLVPRRCAPDEACAVPRTLRNQRILFWLASAVVLALVAFPWYGVALLN